MRNEKNTTFKIDADTTSFDAALKAAQESTQDFGKVFTSTIKTAVMSGKSLEDTLRSLAMRMSTMALNKALAPIENSISDLMTNVLTSMVTPNAKGGVYAQNGPVPFAKGGVVNSPSLFSFAGGTGLMGEAGAEAIMPLSRGTDGRLGIATTANEPKVNVVFNVQATDAVSFKRSEGQLSAMLARAVQRGQRKL